MIICILLGIIIGLLLGIICFITVQYSNKIYRKNYPKVRKMFEEMLRPMQKTEFYEPTTEEERFNNAESVSDLLDN